MASPAKPASPAQVGAREDSFQDFRRATQIFIILIAGEAGFPICRWFNNNNTNNNNTNRSELGKIVFKIFGGRPKLS